LNFPDQDQARCVKLSGPPRRTLEGAHNSLEPQVFGGMVFLPPVIDHLMVFGPATHEVVE
jgi:hypothetical protein